MDERDQFWRQLLPNYRFKLVKGQFWGTVFKDD
jgi:hypothetical protein